MRWVVTSLGTLTFLATTASVGLWLAGYTIPAAVIATTTAALWLLLIVVSTVAVTSWWTRQTMREGAELALRAQDINDRWDANKMNSLAGLMREGAKIGRTEQVRQTEPLPALPPGRDETWLPELVEFDLPMIEAGETDSAVESKIL